MASVVEAKPRAGSGEVMSLESQEHLQLDELSLEDLCQIAQKSALFAILDACNSKTIFAKICEADPDFSSCLYRGKLSQELLEVAPYLIKVDEVWLTWLVKNVWNEPWGVFIVSDADMKLIRKNLRRFLIVEGPNGDPMYFRYYDPRILPTFLSSCTKDELREFFGRAMALGFTSFKVEGAYLVQRKS